MRPCPPRCRRHPRNQRRLQRRLPTAITGGAVAYAWRPSPSSVLRSAPAWPLRARGGVTRSDRTVPLCLPVSPLCVHSLTNRNLQPFSQKSRTPTVAKEFQIGLYDPAEADLELFCNSWSAGFLGERLYVSTSTITVPLDRATRQKQRNEHQKPNSCPHHWPSSKAVATVRAAPHPLPQATRTSAPPFHPYQSQHAPI